MVYVVRLSSPSIPSLRMTDVPGKDEEQRGLGGGMGEIFSDCGLKRRLEKIRDEGTKGL